MRKELKNDRYVNINVGGIWYAIKLSKVIELINEGDIVDKCSINEPIESFSREELKQCIEKEELQQCIELHPQISKIKKRRNERPVDAKSIPF